MFRAALGVKKQTDGNQNNISRIGIAPALEI